MATGMLRRRLLKKTILENGRQKSGLEMDAELRRMPGPEGPETPGPKGRRQHKKWLSPLF